MISDIDSKLNALIEVERSGQRPWGITVLILLDLFYVFENLFLGLMKTWPNLIPNSSLEFLLTKTPQISNYTAFLSCLLYLIAGISLWKRQKWSRYLHFIIAGINLLGMRSVLSLDTIYGLIVIFILLRLDDQTKAYFRIK